MDRFTRMIPESNLEHLKHYRFHAGESTRLDAILSRIWWTPVANLLPMWLSPNVITLMGALCIFLINYCIFTYVPHLDSAGSPRWLPILVSCMMILYMTFDGIDGKQARKLGVSSPLGQLMDHGIDAVVTVFYPYMCFIIFPGGFSFPMMLSIAVAPLHVLTTIWRESEFSTFVYTNGLLGVTETNLCTVFFQLLAYYFKCKIPNMVLYRFSSETMSTFVGKIFPGKVDLLTLVFFVIAVLSYMEGYYSMAKLCCDSSHRLAYITYVLSAMLHSFPAAFLAYSVPMRSKIVGCLFVSTLGAIMCVNNIICLLSKSKLRRFHFGLLPYYLLLARYYGAPLLQGLGYNMDAFVLTPRDLHSFLCGVTIYGFMYLLFIFVKTCHEIATYLKIPFLTVPPRLSPKRSH
ncbi:putative ethanolamine phosphatidyltransferase [Babesia divergens]|uniref:Ethanolamine phosphatidyltransferase n=1 Tax=Babesia divergens TaxID=32595 RepID=A0AAD9GCA4_BABDI|nr:putative ethanolamine phosphatidyltransferase [Babesia divergens]